MMDQMYVSSRQELYFLKNPRHARKWTKSPEGKKKKHTEKCPNMQDQMIKYQDKFQKK